MSKVTKINNKKSPTQYFRSTQCFAYFKYDHNVNYDNVEPVYDKSGNYVKSIITIEQVDQYGRPNKQYLFIKDGDVAAMAPGNNKITPAAIDMKDPKNLIHYEKINKTEYVKLKKETEQKIEEEKARQAIGQ